MLDTKLMAMGIKTAQKFITVISYVVVNISDPAFNTPTKPIGPILSEAKARNLPFPTRKTIKGYRRVVVSPKPKTIVEKREIRKLIEMNFIVICCGGGGIPVIREGRRFEGVDAVIDKDLASAKLAEEVGVNRFIIATDVLGVALDYGTPNERFLSSLTSRKAKQYLKMGYFPSGSMAPKIEACVAAIQKGADMAVICHLSDIEKAIVGKAGTRIIP
jgi:carbamate kinase